MTRKSSAYKFAFTGTNCSGKTTMALAITGRLKEQHVLAEVVSSQDRKITWKDEHFPVDYRAHYGMITNLIHAEVQAELKGDAHCVLTDRSVLDLYAIATYDHPNNPQIAAMEQMILEWAGSYHTIFYLEPLPYQEDNKRPSDDFRMATHNQLICLLGKYNLPNVVKMPRNEIYKHIKGILGVAENAPFAEDEKWQAIATLIGKPLLVKEPASSYSDYDVWILADYPYPGSLADDTKKVKQAFLQFWGANYTEASIDVLTAPENATSAVLFPHKVHRPNV